MDLTLTPNTEALAASGITPADFSVRHGPLRVGRIRGHGTTLSPLAKFVWVFAIHEGPNDMRRSGVAATVEEALAVIKVSWQQWLAWAVLSEREAAADKPSADANENSPDDELIGAVLREARRAARG